MGIYTRLESSIRVNPLDKALARLHYCSEAIMHFQRDKLFVPKKVTIWLDAPSKSLKGRSIYEREIDNFYETAQALKIKFARSFYPDELPSSIIMFEGQWNINDLELGGFFSCNNHPVWNRAYFDVEIDTYSKGEYGDLIDVFLKDMDIMPGIIKTFIMSIDSASQKQTAQPRYIYFSRGVPEYGEVEDLIALHLRDRHDMTSFLYAKLRKIKEAWVKEKVEPIDRGFYITSLVSIETVERLFTEVVKQTELIERIGNSITYIGKDPTTLSKFFEAFKESIFAPASKDLPDADTLKRAMKNGLDKNQTHF